MLARGGRTRQVSRHCTVPEHATIKDFAPALRVLWDFCGERAGGRRQGGRGNARPSLTCVMPGRAQEERSRARPWRGQWGTATHLHRRPPLTVRRTGNKREFPGISGKDCARGADIRESVAHNAWPRHTLARASRHSATQRAKRRRFTTASGTFLSTRIVLGQGVRVSAACASSTGAARSGAARQWLAARHRTAGQPRAGAACLPGGRSCAYRRA